MQADIFDVDAQRQIEEEIRLGNVNENMELAMDLIPESFGRVVMLYVPAEVGGVYCPAFVDSGAQSTIMSAKQAQKCGIMRLLDTRFAGIAKGVGTSRILVLFSVVILIMITSHTDFFFFRCASGQDSSCASQAGQHNARVFVHYSGK
jgi:hypothetical protein